MRMQWTLLVLIGLSAVAMAGAGSLAQSPAIYAPILRFRPKPKPERPQEELSPPKVTEKYVVRPGEVAGRARATTGDSLRIDQTTFRLWGVVAPPMNEFGGYTAMQGLAALVGGKTVVCTPTGNFLGSVRLARCRSEDRDVATAIVARGWVLRGLSTPIGRDLRAAGAPCGGRCRGGLQAAGRMPDPLLSRARGQKVGLLRPIV